MNTTIKDCYRIEEGIGVFGLPAVTVYGTGEYDLALTFDCGQCFRFEPHPTLKSMYEGVAFGRYVIFEGGENRITVHGSAYDDFCNIWYKFLALDRDWTAIKNEISSLSPVFKEPARIAGGIRILKQDEFEAFISFIISQCNNIPRIKGLISKLSQKYGEEIVTPDGRSFYTFPTAEVLSKAELSDLSALKLGYRAEYVKIGAENAASGLLEDCKNAKTTKEAKAILKSSRGNGEKVASCALLFGFGRLDAFPIDVWIKRAMAHYFPDVKDPEAAFGRYAGVAQQYLFYCERYIGNEEN